MDQNILAPARLRKAKAFADARRNMLAAFLDLIESKEIGAELLHDDADAVGSAMHQLVGLHHA